MSSSKDSGGGVSKNVLTLEGTSNYHAWLVTIRSFLMTLKVWRIASGESTCPAVAGPDQNTWLDLDYQAVGVISLYVKEDLRTAVVLTYEDPKISLAYRTLTNLATLYATTGPTGQFYHFRDIVTWRLGGENHRPRLPISSNCSPSFLALDWFSPITSRPCCYALAWATTTPASSPPQSIRLAQRNSHLPS